MQEKARNMIVMTGSSHITKKELNVQTQFILGIFAYLFIKSKNIYIAG